MSINGNKEQVFYREDVNTELLDHHIYSITIKIKYVTLVYILISQIAFRASGNSCLTFLLSTFP